VRADRHVGGRDLGRKPFALDGVDVRESARGHVLLQQAEHGGRRIDGRHARDARRKLQRVAPRARPHVEHRALGGHLAQDAQEERILVGPLVQRRSIRLRALAPVVDRADARPRVRRFHLHAPPLYDLAPAAQAVDPRHRRRRNVRHGRSRR